jgi:hypothetical protein
LTRSATGPSTDALEEKRVNHIWKPNELERIASSGELEISSPQGRGPDRRWTPIWVVRVDDGLYIRSLLGKGSKWYRRAAAGRVARIRTGGFEGGVLLEDAAEPRLNARVDDAYRAKYADQPRWLDTAVGPAAAATTMRLVPSVQPA